MKPPAGGVPLLARLSGLRYSPDPTRAFRLAVDRLEIRGPAAVLLGRSGSGKTSLLEILLGLRAPDAGDVVLMGTPVRGFDALPWGRVGYLPQFSERLLFAESVEEEVAFGARAAGVGPEALAARVDESLRSAGLAPEADRGRSPHRMSFGQKRRVALASILSSSPGLLVLDEPSAGLDLAGFRVLRDLLRTRGGQRRPFLLATHDLALASAVGTEFLVLDRGTVASAWEGAFDPERLPHAEERGRFSTRGARTGAGGASRAASERELGVREGENRLDTPGGL